MKNDVPLNIVNQSILIFTCFFLSAAKELSTWLIWWQTNGREQDREKVGIHWRTSARLTQLTKSAKFMKLRHHVSCWLL